MPILKKMAVPIVALIEFHHISGQKTPHASCQRYLSCFAEEMKVVWYQGPSVDLKAAFFNEESKSGEKIVSILIGQEDPPSLDPAPHDVMEDTRSV